MTTDVDRGHLALRDEHHRPCAHRRYLMTCDEFNALYDEVGGRCQLCGRHETDLGQPLYIDHDGRGVVVWRVRGLLCHTDNLYVGDGSAPTNDDVRHYLARAWWSRDEHGPGPEPDVDVVVTRWERRWRRNDDGLWTSCTPAIAARRPPCTWSDLHHRHGPARPHVTESGSPIPLSNETANALAADLRERIRTGDLAPGDRLPSEPELARTHGIARMTVRSYLQPLIAEGLLHRVRGSGTFVGPAPDTVTLALAVPLDVHARAEAAATAAGQDITAWALTALDRAAKPRRRRNPTTTPAD